MNYEFHVGDYVKTRAGYVGYIENIEFQRECIDLYIRYTDGDCHCFEATDLNVSNNFLRVGTYDFTKKKNKKIEPMRYTDLQIANDVPLREVVCDLKNKLNELVDTVNELRNEEDK